MLRKEILATKHLRELMTQYYINLCTAHSEGHKVAWCTSVGPAELLYSFGFRVYFPENHAAMLGAARTANNYIPVATAIGYSPDICSYLTSDIGAFLKKESPLFRYGAQELPRPDVLVYNTNQCREVQEWFAFYARMYRVPLLGINTPRAIDELNNDHIKVVQQQMENMVEPLEKLSDRKFDMNDLQKCLQLSYECTMLWKAVLDTAANIPAPLTFFDGTIHMGPVVVMRGTQPPMDYYRILKNELDQRVRDGIAAVEGERFRLYWDGMPVWGKLRELSELFIRLKTCIAASTYCNSWVFEAYDPSKPFYSMAKAYTEIFINRSERIKEMIILDFVRRFKLDGVIFHDSKTCPNNSNARFGMPQRLRERGIPTLVLDGDLNDLRCYSSELARTNIEAFIEQLEAD